MEEFTIRFADYRDLERLSVFFGRAYGSDSVFCDLAFVKWFLDDHAGSLGSVVAIDNQSEEIVGHYGFLQTKLQIAGRSLDFGWGVSAYTLDSYRGKKLGKKLLELVLQRCPTFGVFGFSEKTAHFYAKFGFSVLPTRARTYVKVLSEKMSEITTYIGKEEDANSLLFLPTDEPIKKLKDLSAVIALSESDLPRCDISSEVMHAGRNPENLRWRYFDFPEPKYELFGVKGDNDKVSTYIALRQVQLKPTQLTATRIIDIFGEPKDVETLLNFAAQRSEERGDVYIDFSVVGTSLESSFSKEGFCCLVEGQMEVIPQRVSPMQAKRNNEYIGLVSKEKDLDLSSLSEDDVFFTRFDSDRDRLVKLSDLTAEI